MDRTHELAIPINNTTHLYVRANQTRITIEIISHEVDEESGSPTEMNGHIISMSPEQFGKMVAGYQEILERLCSKSVH